MNELTARKDGNILKIYQVKDLWNAYGIITVENTPILTDEDLWVFNQGNITQELLVARIKNVNSADLDFPVTLYHDGRIADGFHRILHAHTLGIKDIKVRTLCTDPEPVNTLTLAKYLKLIR
ncbi:MAG: hypothetical protein GQ576_03185 [Methanococcoides sp.]|nr:hypothetical protein [Methanococcoides sp.]